MVLSKHDEDSNSLINLLRLVAQDLRDWIFHETQKRALEGKRSLKANPSDNKQVWEWLSEHYISLRENQKIPIDFQQFALEVFFIFDYPWTNRQRSKHYSPWYGSKCSFRGHSKYVKNQSHQKKEKVNNKKAWRIEKGIDRDKSKAGNPYHFGSKKTWINFEERSYRRFVKRKIRSEDWDALGDDWIQDAWIWD